MNLRFTISRVHTVCAFLLLMMVLTGCKDNSPTNPDTTNNTASAIEGDWVFIGATLWDSDGSATTVTVSGDLYLRADKTWQQNRTIGLVTAGGKGTYSVNGDRITLKHDDASKDLVYTFVLGSAQGTNGDTVRTLALSSMKNPDGSYFDYALVEGG